MNPRIHPAKLQIAVDAAQLLFICGSILTRQLNSRTRVEVREDPQEPATSSHVSLTAESFAVLLSLSSLALLQGIDGAVDGLAICIREGRNLSQQDQ